MVIIAITERDNTNTENYFIGTTAVANNQGLHVGYRISTSITLDQFSNGLDQTIPTYNPLTSSPALIKAVNNSASGKTISVLENGSEFSNSNSNTAGLTGAANGVLGQGFATATGFEGHISEVLVYDRVLSTTERSQVDSYLAIKYGVTLDQTSATDYLASDNTVKMWDATVNSAYNNDIAGIGRDDDSDLDQRVSKSVNPDALVAFALDNNFTDANNAAGRTTAHAADLSFMTWGNNSSASTAPA